MNTLSNRFFQAITLCSGDRAIKPRLTQAWTEQLDEISPAELPGSIRKEFLRLRKAMYAGNRIDPHAVGKFSGCC